jgi:hypothetical protein
MQGYFLKLLGNYRSFIHPELPPRPASASATAPPPSRARASAGVARSSATSSGSHAPADARPLGRASMPAVVMRSASPSFTQPAGGASPEAHAARRRSEAATAALDPDAIRGSGYVFDHTGLVASHRRDGRARALLQQLRQSQMYEVFVQERLAMAAVCGHGREGLGRAQMCDASAAKGGSGHCEEESGAGEHKQTQEVSNSGAPKQASGGGWNDDDGAWDEGGDPFEERVSAYLENRSRRLAAARAGAGGRSSLARFQVK